MNIRKVGKEMFITNLFIPDRLFTLLIVHLYLTNLRVNE